MDQPALYYRMGGYPAVTHFADSLLFRLEQDPRLKHFRGILGSFGIMHRRDLLINFLAHHAGGPVDPSGTDDWSFDDDMTISDDEWSLFLHHTHHTLKDLSIPDELQWEIASMATSLRDEISHH